MGSGCSAPLPDLPYKDIMAVAFRTDSIVLFYAGKVFHFLFSFQIFLFYKCCCVYGLLMRHKRFELSFIIHFVY